MQPRLPLIVERALSQASHRLSEIGILLVEKFDLHEQRVVARVLVGIAFFPFVDLNDTHETQRSILSIVLPSFPSVAKSPRPFLNREETKIR